MDGLVLLAFLLIAVVLGGSLCGWFALIRQSRMGAELQRLGAKVRVLEARLASAGPEALRAEPPSAVRDAAPPAKPTEAPTPAGIETVAVRRVAVPPPLPPRPTPAVEPSRATLRPTASLEVLLGTKWMGWAGALLVVIGTGFFLKWVYDRGLIPPEGRLAIGALGGVVALGLGERFRRRSWQPAFQTMTGIGIAVFYLCVFFAFHIYELAGQSTAFGLATLVTALAVVMAVAHNALPIAVLGVTGGLLSPVIFSSGGNHPYLLFCYLLVIDLVALGAAGFRRWRALDLLCFFGTAALYGAWYVEYYDGPGQMLPALLFISLFYTLFLAIPTLYSLVRRIPERVEGLVLVVADSICSLIILYHTLYPDYRELLGFAVVVQAVLVFGLFRIWQLRIHRDSATAKSLLGISLGLVTLAVPLNLRLYGIPLAWACEGVVLMWLGTRYREPLVRIGALAALTLAVWGLLQRLPLHDAAFLPVANAPFASWIAVIGAIQVAAWLQTRRRPGEPAGSDAPQPQWAALEQRSTTIAGLAGFALGCLVVSMELALYWELTARVGPWQSRQAASLVALWSVIPAAVTAYVYRRPLPWVWLAGACYLTGCAVFLVSLVEYSHPTQTLALNTSFLGRLPYVLALFGAAWAARRRGLPTHASIGLDVAANILLALLVASEFTRWSRHSELVSGRMGIALISAAWAVQAFVLIWVGLALRAQPLRWLGMALFGLTAAKVLLIDTAQLGHIYRIVSLMATGVLLLAAMSAYHHYRARLLGPDEGGTPS